MRLRPLVIILTLAAPLLTGVFTFGDVVGPASAQGDPLGLTNNTTSPSSDPYQFVTIVVSAQETMAHIEERQTHSFRIEVVDITPPAYEAYTAAPISVQCAIVNQTDVDRGWAFNAGVGTQIGRNQAKTIPMTLTAGARASPEFYSVEVGCRAGSPLSRDLGTFRIIGHVQEYTYLVLSPGAAPGSIGPDADFTYPVVLQNTGNQDKLFIGDVNVDQPGWRLSWPKNILVPAGESVTLNVSGISPREKLVYLSEAHTITVSYWPAGQEGKAQTVFVPMQVDGIYIHPAIMPLTLLALIILGTLIFMAVLAKRQIEEQILGKPVPPWRIPVERAYLEELEKTDPDEHYIVRHYLMEEEHASALLWYSHFKKATKNDRRAETKWFKTKKKQERKIAKLEKEHVKLSKKWERKLKFLEWRRKRKLKKVDRKLKALNKGLQAKLDKAHKKEVVKLKKRFRKDKKKLKKRQKKAEKKTLRKHDKVVRKEERKLYRENCKRARRGEDLLPPPEIPEPEMPRLQVEEPDYPERPIAQEMLLSETKFQKKADRINTRFDKKRARKEAKRDRILARHRARVDGKTQRLLVKIPAEPKTHLYDHDEYVPEDEIIIEDDRSALARWLNIPTLEERELARRRMEVHQARRIRLTEAGDEEGLKRLDADWKEARKRVKTERKEHAVAAHAAVKEEEALSRQRRKDARRRAKELTREAKVEAKEMRVDQKAQAKAKRDAPNKVPVKTPASAPSSSESEESRLKLRFGRRKAGKSEEGRTESAATASDKGQE